MVPANAHACLVMPSNCKSNVVIGVELSMSSTVSYKGAYNRTSKPAARPAKFYLARQTPAPGVEKGAGV